MSTQGRKGSLPWGLILARRSKVLAMLCLLVIRLANPFMGSHAKNISQSFSHHWVFPLLRKWTTILLFPGFALRLLGTRAQDAERVFLFQGHELHGGPRSHKTPSYPLCPCESLLVSMFFRVLVSKQGSHSLERPSGWSLTGKTVTKGHHADLRHRSTCRYEHPDPDSWGCGPR